jgi:hypothetical protein
LYKLLLILTILFSQNVFANLQQAGNVFNCFSFADSYEYSSSLSGRNRGFDTCLKIFSIPQAEINCSSLADRYYGLAFKNRALGICISRTTTLRSCLRTADTMPAVTKRASESMKCLRRLSSTMTKSECYSVGSKYHHIKNTSNNFCNAHFKESETVDSDSQYLGTGESEVIKL